MVCELIKIEKYIEAINKIITAYVESHTKIIKVESFKPEGIVSQVIPSVLSALMTFGEIQNKSLDDINLLIKDITTKLIPYVETKIPNYNITELLIVVEKLAGFKKMLEIACEHQKPLSVFDYDKLTESDIVNVFADMAIIIKISEEANFKLAAINSRYSDFFRPEKIFFVKSFTTNKITKSYNLIFRMCSFMKLIPTLEFLMIIGTLSRGNNDYKKYNDGEILIPQYKKLF